MIAPHERSPRDRDTGSRGVTRWASSAPGKILIAGEYAVIAGGDAVVMAIDRRARAEIVERPQALSPFLAAAARAVDQELGGVCAALMARVVVDSGPLRDDSGAKLGLGSSAAAVTAAIAACLPPPLDRTLLHRIAHRAHAAAQGSGSGADVAASVWGGVLRLGAPLSPGEPLAVAPLSLPDDLVLVPVWLGQPADTRTLVAQVADFARSDPAACRPLFARVSQAAADLAGATSTEQALAALAEGGLAAAELGRAAGVEIATRGHQLLAERASARGGVAKPTGAGGGDVALGAFPDRQAAERFRSDASSLGMKPLALSVDPDGARLEPGAT